MEAPSPSVTAVTEEVAAATAAAAKVAGALPPSTAVPAHGEVMLDLELLRLRVLATRKRPKSEKEEGEVSDTEPPPPPLMPSPPDVLGEGYYDYRQHHRRRKRERFFFHDSLMATPHEQQQQQQQLSSSFEPQSCTIFLADSEAECDGPTAAAGMPAPFAVPPAQPAISAVLGSVAYGVLQRELQRQVDMLAQLQAQMAQLEEEGRLLAERFSENEALISESVASQQRLKAELRETKQRIMQRKDLRTELGVRRERLNWELSKRAKLRAALQASIQSKQAVPRDERRTEGAAREGEREGEREGGREGEERSSVESMAIDNNGGGGGTSAPKSARTVQLAELEKQALRVRQELMASQIELMRRRAVHAKTRHLGKAGKPHTPLALGKVMGISPAWGMTVDDDDADNEGAPLTGEAPHLLEAAFPERLYSVGGQLLPGSLLHSIVETVSSLIQHNLAPSSPEATTPHHDSEVEEEAVIRSAPRIGAAISPTAEDRPPAKFVPYESPLRAFKAYRFSPHFHHSAATGGILSPSFTHRIRPDAFVCTFSLAGGCSRPNCRGQHAKAIFMDDASVLEDFVTTLLGMPVTTPFRDQAHLLTHVKEQFLRMAKSAQPLVALVGVLLDAHRMMPVGPHTIAFSGSAGTRQYEMAVRSLISLGGRRAEASIPQLDRRRCFLKGVAGLRGGDLPRMWRYFGGGSGDGDVGVGVGDGSGGPDEQEDGARMRGWIESFLTTLAQGSVKSRDTLQAAAEILDAAVRANPCELFQTLHVDFQTICSNNNNNNKTVEEGEDAVLLPWMRLAGAANGSYEDQCRSFGALFDCAPPSATVVDYVYYFVKLACDRGQADDAVALLQLVLGKVIDEAYGGPLDLGQVLAQVGAVEFSATDTAYLAMLYFYVRDTRTYPQQALLPFPLDMIRRLDFYYLQPWSAPELWADDLVFLERLCPSLALEGAGASTVLDWCVANMAELAAKLGIEVARDGPCGSSPSTRSLLIARHGGMRAEDRALVRPHPLVVVTLIDSIARSGQDDEQVKREIVLNLLRSFWCDQFGGILSDADIVIAVGRVLGLSELFPVSTIGISVDERLAAGWRRDPFLWMLAGVSMVLLSAATAGMVDVVAEAALASVEDAPSAAVLLLAYSLASVHECSARGMGDAAVDRVVGIAENAHIVPASTVGGRWEGRPWTGTLGSPFDEFVQLNVPKVDDAICLLHDLLRGLRIDYALPITSPFIAFRTQADLPQTLSLLRLHPTDAVLWAMALRMSSDDPDLRALKQKLEQESRTVIRT